MWSYSLSLGASHALLNDSLKNAKIMNLLTPDERNLIDAARKLAVKSGRSRNNTAKFSRS